MEAGRSQTAVAEDWLEAGIEKWTQTTQDVLGGVMAGSVMAME